MITKDLIINNDECVLIHGSAGHDTSEGYTDYEFVCFMFIPPKSITNATWFTMSYVYWEKDYVNPDATLSKYKNISTPWFLTNQWKYSVYYDVFDITEFLDDNQEYLDEWGYEYVLYYASNWGESFYGFPFSFTNIRLTLQKFIPLYGDEIVSFDANKQDTIIY